MIPRWPTDLPQRLSRDGFGEGFADGRLQTEMESGVPKTRRRFSAAIRPIQASIDVPIDGKARLMRFWDEETGGGSVPFLIPDTTMNGAPLLAGGGLVLTDEQDRPLLVESWHLCVFGKTPPSSQNLGGPWYRVTFSLSVLPR